MAEVRFSEIDTKLYCLNSPATNNEFPFSIIDTIRGPYKDDIALTIREAIFKALTTKDPIYEFSEIINYSLSTAKKAFHTKENEIQILRHARSIDKSIDILNNTLKEIAANSSRDLFMKDYSFNYRISSNDHISTYADIAYIDNDDNLSLIFIPPFFAQYEYFKVNDLLIEDDNGLAKYPTFEHNSYLNNLTACISYGQINNIKIGDIYVIYINPSFHNLTRYFRIKEIDVKNRDGYSRYSSELEYSSHLYDFFDFKNHTPSKTNLACRRCKNKCVSFLK